MSVATPDRNKSKTEFDRVYYRILSDSIQITDNKFGASAKMREKRHKFIETMCGRVDRVVADVGTHIRIANSIYPTAPEAQIQAKQRRVHQEKAIGLCFDLMTSAVFAFVNRFCKGFFKGHSFIDTSHNSRRTNIKMLAPISKTLGNAINSDDMADRAIFRLFRFRNERAIIGRILFVDIFSFNTHSFLITVLISPFIKTVGVIKPFVTDCNAFSSIVFIRYCIRIVTALLHTLKDNFDWVIGKFPTLTEMCSTRTAFCTSTARKRGLSDIVFSMA